MDIVQAIDQLVPKAKYGGYPRDREHFDRLRWRDARSKPSWEEIEPLLSQPAPEPEAARKPKAPPEPAGTTIAGLKTELAAWRTALIQAGVWGE